MKAAFAVLAMSVACTLGGCSSDGSNTMFSQGFWHRDSNAVANNNDILQNDKHPSTQVVYDRSQLSYNGPDAYGNQVYDGRVYTSDGRMVSDGRVVTSDGRVVTSDGRVVTNDGRVVASDGRATAVLRAQDVMHFLAEAFPREILNLPPRPNQTLPKPEGG